jgi:hypothetical protein
MAKSSKIPIKSRKRFFHFKRPAKKLKYFEANLLLAVTTKRLRAVAKF